MASRLTRRRLLTRGGGAAGVAALGGLTGLAGRAQAQGKDGAQRPNVVLIVADRLRADYVKAYDDVYDDRPAKTPSIDALADASLRFRYAVPEGMPAIPVRRGILTGMRSYPFRDWRTTAGVPAVPGWSKIYDFQPLLPELTAQAGIETVYVTDNPTLAGPRFDFVRRTGPLPRSTGYTPTERSYLLPLRTDKVAERREPTERVLRHGIGLIDELKRKQPFFLGLDAFDPVDAFALPRQYIRGAGPLHDDTSLPFDRRFVDQVEVDVDDGVVDEVRGRYAEEVTSVDGWVGKLLDKLDDAGLADNTVVVLVGDSGIALGEQGVFGHPAGMWHRRVYQVPLILRDPRRRWAGDTSSWFVSTHDIPSTILSYYGITAPGKVAGEDLTTLFDDDDLPPRPYFTSAIDSHIVAGDRTWLLIGRTDQDRWRLYKTDDPDDPDDIWAETDISPTILESIKRYVIAAAGGTLPELGAEGVIRPAAPRETSKQVADDGTLNQDEAEAQELR